MSGATLGVFMYATMREGTEGGRGSREGSNGEEGLAVGRAVREG